MVTMLCLLVHADAMNDTATHSVMTVFRSRLRPDAAANGYAELAVRMESRARTMAGFIDFKTFTAADGERASIITFDTWKHHRAWRDDPEHRAAQRRGRQDCYAEYSIFVYEKRHHHKFSASLNKPT
jgi:heme-degrading monooxygenase HmoA